MNLDVQRHLLFLIPLLPGLSAAVLGLTWAAGRKLERPTVNALALGSVLSSFGLSVLAAMELAGLPAAERHLTNHLWNWFTVGGLGGAAPHETFTVPFAFEVDPLSAVMILVVTGIGFLIHLFATSYMEADEGYQKFFSYLNLFMFSMLILVLGNSFLTMFIGWEGVGLCSYLLIGFWYKELPNARAAMKAFVVNRVGDFLFITGLLALVWLVGQRTGFYSVVFRDMAAHAPVYAEAQRTVTFLGLPIVTFATLCFFGGATGKSAQIPLFVWLPDAMAGPTPVSALIHAATMVTSGIYMITRLNFLFDLAPATLLVVGTVGALTAVMAAAIGLFQYDIKKVLAYSTVSQLGYMFLGLGTGAYAAGMFHVFTHAFFKALMFLGSGSVIHAMHHALPHGVDPQDMRNMGGLRKFMPVTFLTFLAGWLAICGIFPFSGFWSKDEILWKAFEKGWYGHQSWYFVLYALGLAGAAMTAFYMTRQVAMVFFGDYRGRKVGEAHRKAHAHHDADAHGHHALHDPHESPSAITVPLRVLAVGSVLVGFLGVGGWFTAWTGVANRWNAWLAPVVGGAAPHAAVDGDEDRRTAEAAVETLTLLAAGGEHGHARDHATDAAHAAPAHAAAGHEGSPAATIRSGHASASHGGSASGGAHHAPPLFEFAMALLSVAVAVLSMRFAWKNYVREPSRPAERLARFGPGGRDAASLAGRFYLFAYEKFRVDELYHALFVAGTLLLSRVSARIDAVVDFFVNATASVTLVVRWIAGRIDAWIVDGLIFGGVAHLSAWGGRHVRTLQTGDLQSYLRWAGYGALASIGTYFFLVFFQS